MACLLGFVIGLPALTNVLLYVLYDAPARVPVKLSCKFKNFFNNTGFTFLNVEPALDNSLVILSVSDCVNVALPDTSLYVASSIQTELTFFNFDMSAPKDAFIFCNSFPVYVVCHTTPIFALLICFPKSESWAAA